MQDRASSETGSCSIEDRKVVPAALSMEKKTTAPAAALELPDGKIIYGKTSDLLGAPQRFF